MDRDDDALGAALGALSGSAPAARAQRDMGHCAAAANPFEGEELALLRAEQRGSAYPLGDRPLVVITAGNAEHGPGERGMEEDRQRAQAALVRLSSRGRQVIAEGSGHHVHIERPALVADAIREVAAAAARR